LDRIDAHCHVVADHEDSRAMLESRGLRLLNIALGTDPRGRWRTDPCTGTEVLERTSSFNPARCGWCTAFDDPRFDDPGWADSVIVKLKADFARGAVGVKVWKNIGLKVRLPGKGNILPDDPVFEPVYSWLEREGKTLVIHAGEPAIAWLPLDPLSPHYLYFRDNPGQHLRGKPNVPSHAEIMRARDNIMERHPRLRVVGCHLGSLEHDLNEVAVRLDRYPNFAVDTAARVLDFSTKDAVLVREFFAKYRGRILWGTDVFTEKPHSAMSPEERAKSVADLQRRWMEEFSYYESSGEIAFLGWMDKPRMVAGLGLPTEILADFYSGNALRWYPGLFGKG